MAGGCQAASPRCTPPRGGRRCNAIASERPQYAEASLVSTSRARMEAECQEGPDAVSRQTLALRSPLAELLRRVKRRPPNLVLTCARGSSAHSATFGKHLIERYLGIPVAAFAPNISTIYR